MQRDTNSNYPAKHCVYLLSNVVQALHKYLSLAHDQVLVFRSKIFIAWIDEALKIPSCKSGLFEHK